MPAASHSPFRRPLSLDDPVRTVRNLLVVATLAILTAGPAAGQGPELTVTGALSGLGSPFIRTELLTFTVTADPLMPVPIFVGAPAAAPITVPGVSGSLEVAPPLAPFGPFDGLGLFGPPGPYRTDVSGILTFTILIPPGFPVTGLPGSLEFQALVLQDPAFSPMTALALTNGVLVVIDEPFTSPDITEIGVVASPTCAVVVEGSTDTLVLLRGTGFLARSSVVPEVTFILESNPSRSAPATSVALVTDPFSPSGVALLVGAPSDLGGPSTPLDPGVGPVLVEVRYAARGLYPNNPSQGETITAPTGPADPTFLGYQVPVALTPVVSNVFPKAGLVAGGCPVTITGEHFLLGAEVIFDVGGTPVSGTSPTVVSGTTVTVVVPPHAELLGAVAIRNPDDVPCSPRQSLIASPDTDFVWFDFQPSDVTVTGIAPGAIIEGTGGGPITDQSKPIS